MMTRTCIIAFVQLCFCINISFSQNTVLNGRILDKNSKQAIEYATVYCTNTAQGAYSKDDGSFHITEIKEGFYTFKISCIGYHTIKKEIEIKKGINTFNFSLEESSENLTPVVITATGTQFKIEDVPVQTEVISSKTIQEISGRSVEEMISSISSSFDFTSSSMGTNIKINGLGKDYILVLVNGKRLTGDIGGKIDLSRINTDDIEQIEIVKGASSTLYGSDAISGVINIITKRNKGKLEVSNSSRVGAYNEWKQLNTIEFNKNKVSGKTSFSRKQTDGWQLNNMKLNPKWNSNHDLPFLVKTYDMPVNKKQSYTLKQSFTYNISEKISFNTEFSWYEKTLYFPFKGRMHNYYYNNIYTSLGGNYKLKNKNYIDFNIDYGNYKYYSEYPYKYNERYFTQDGIVSATYYPGDKFKNSDKTNLTAQFKGVFHLNSKNTLSFGTEMLGDYMEAKYRLTRNKVSAYTLSVYAQDEIKIIKNLDLIAGVRAIHHRTFGLIATPKISGMYKIGRFTCRASYSNGFKTPTLKQLYYYYESNRMGIYRLYLGNEGLKPQTSNYYSFSTEYKHNKIRTSLNLYLNQLHNMIDYKIIPTEWENARRGIEETKLLYNINKASSAGFDFMFHTSVFTSLSISAGYSFVEAKNLTLNIPLNGVSKHSATFKASWTNRWKKYKLKLNLIGQYKSEKFYLEEDLNRSFAKPYQLWKLSSNHQFKSYKKMKMELIAGIDNILNYVDDSPYGSHYGTLNPGRTIFMGLNIKFKG